MVIFNSYVKLPEGTYFYFAIGCSFVIFADSIFAALGEHAGWGRRIRTGPVRFGKEKMLINIMLIVC